ncbi:MAG: hypothetical protein AMXMBFR84_09820 [Candidatus Hydrogenedentota bacterium]
MPGENAFPKAERLRRKTDFDRVYTDGRKCVGTCFICFATRQEGQGRKFGCTVSRKVGDAVTRNRVKRYLREVYRTHRARISDDVHLVFVARPAAAELDFHQCQQAIRRLLEKGDVLNG